MSWFVNDVSLSGQYDKAADFNGELKEILAAKLANPLLKSFFYCSKSLACCQVTSVQNLQQAVMSERNPDYTRSVLSWLTSVGPFWEDIRQNVPDDYFEFDGVDVTDRGLGEAARHLSLNLKADSFSFSGGGFDFSPVKILHGLPEDPLGDIDVVNIWKLAELIGSAVQRAPLPVNWVQMLNLCREKYSNLVLIDECVDSLKREPFSEYACHRFIFLLSILDRYQACLNIGEDGESERNELRDNFFTGTKALFTDESKSNKIDFESEMTFVDPSNGEEVFCPFHGKIKTPQYRVHFEWPPVRDRKIRVFYLGPKITKS
ncbi:hypothetical protein [Vogesella indigofera]|uniref:hypothetical protein n=1 Tax=Vogesella indigofera TaxID=45465 RepID=UPI00234E8B67|nr:hypothetical protein [Vogesella indigofera]MDC7699574.1 hypothetical protein [Vogesella indigofera]